MSIDFELILEDCLARMRAGFSMEECLILYQAQAHELRPLLSKAVFLRSISAPKTRPAAVENGRQRIFAALEQQNWVDNPPVPSISKSTSARYIERAWKFLQFILIGKENNGMKFALRLAFYFVAILAIGGVLTVKASTSAIPGDPLYGVKRTWEDVHLALTIQDPSRQELQTQLEIERRAEIEKLLQIRRSIVVEFEGVLEQISDELIVVSGIRIQRTIETIIKGVPVVGYKVEMLVSIQSDGQLIAQKLQTENSDSQGSAPTPKASKTPRPTDGHGKIIPTATLTSTIMSTAQWKTGGLCDDDDDDRDDDVGDDDCDDDDDDYDDDNDDDDDDDEGGDDDDDDGGDDDDDEDNDDDGDDD